MKAVKQTMGLMLTHSIAMLISVVIITAAFGFFQYNLALNNDVSNPSLLPALMINLTLSVLMGVFIGGGMKSLQHSYLWTINQRYRNVLMAAFLIIIMLYSLLLIPAFYINTKGISWLFILPFCMAIFSSHMVIGKKWIHKILIPAVPIALYQLTRFKIGLNTIVIFIACATLVLIFAMYHNYFNSEQRNIKKEQDNAMAVASTGLNLKWVMGFNYMIGIVIARAIAQSKRKVDWAIIMPHTKLALFSLLYVIIIVGFVLMNSDKGDRPLLEAFSIMFLASSFISLIMESRQLIRQTRFFSHVFIGERHRQLKNKILWSMDKVFVVNSVVFIIGIFIASFVFSMPLNKQYLLISMAAVMLFALSYYPILLCLKWLNISFVLLASIILYASIIFFSVKWIKTHTSEFLTSPYTWLFIIFCLILRGITQYIFWQRPFETLIKNK